MEIQIISKYRKMLMGIAALWIFIFHCWIYLTDMQSLTILRWTENLIKKTGFAGVDIFLLLSGMGLVYSISKDSQVIHFFTKRLKRVLIPYVIIGVISAIMEKWSFTFLCLQLSSVNFWIQDIYSFLWFGVAIFYFYLFFPFYYKLFDKSKNKLLFTVSAFEIWLVVAIFLSQYIREDLFGFINRFPVFMFGIYIGWLCVNKKIELEKNFFIAMLITFVLGMILAILTTIKGVTIIIPASNCSFPNMLIAVSIVFLLSGICEFISKHPVKTNMLRYIVLFFEFLGQISFELYCVQIIVQKAVLNKLDGIFYPAIISIIVFICSVICAYILWKINEIAIKRLSVLFNRK